MAGDDPEAVELLRVTRDFGDTYADVTVWVVPATDRYPDGVKYSMQYGDEEGETIVRYDNFPDHDDSYRHHRHAPGGEVVPLDFRGVHSLYERFKEEVRDHGEHWPDD